MKVKLVFDRWWVPVSQQDSDYFSWSHLHAGTTFNAEIDLSIDEYKEIQALAKDGVYPMFYAIENQMMKVRDDSERTNSENN